MLRELKRLLDYGEDAESMVFEDHFGNFIQFRKFIHSPENWGIDLVFPIVASYRETGGQATDIARKHGAKFCLVETEYGWPFVFMQVSSSGILDEDLCGECFDLAELNFERKVGPGEGGTFDHGRKRKVFGNTESASPGQNRYSVENPQIL